MAGETPAPEPTADDEPDFTKATQWLHGALDKYFEDKGEPESEQAAVKDDPGPEPVAGSGPGSAPAAAAGGRPAAKAVKAEPDAEKAREAGFDIVGFLIGKR